MTATIVIKNSSTGAAVPTVGQLQRGELAVNLVDKKIYTKDNTDAVVVLAEPVSLAGVVTETGTQTLTNKTLTAPALSGAVLNDGYTEEIFAVTGTTPALSPTNGSVQTWTLSGASTPTAGTWADGQSITLMVDDGSAFSITWTSVAPVWKTNGGSAPTLLTTGFTVIQLWKVGSTIYGARVGDA
jgi:hypothetical protein